MMFFSVSLEHCGDDLIDLTVRFLFQLCSGRAEYVIHLVVPGSLLVR